MVSQLLEEPETNPQTNHSILVSIWNTVFNSLYCNSQVYQAHAMLLYFVFRSKRASYWKPLILLLWITTLSQTTMFIHFCISLIFLWSTWSLLQAKETSEKCLNCFHVTVNTNYSDETFSSVQYVPYVFTLLKHIGLFKVMVTGFSQHSQQFYIFDVW